MRTVVRRECPGEEEGANYKQLYLECKRKVGIFMGQVEAQIGSILQKHEAEKRHLQEEIDRLRSDLRDQGHNTSMHFSKISIHSHNQRRNSESKINTQSSVSREAVEECLAKFSRAGPAPREDRRGGCEPGKEEKRVSFRQNQQEKQNRVTPVNVEEEGGLGDLKLIAAAPRRDRMREKKLEGGEKAENIKDVLKGLRGRLTSRDKGGLRERDDNVQPLITPDLFASHRNRA